MNALKRLWAYIRLHPLYGAGGVVVLAVAVILVHHFTAAQTPSSTPDSGLSHVSVQSVSSLSSQTGPLAVVGTIKSVDQATVLAQSAGELTHLYRALGDRVAAGQIIGEFENSAQVAAVTQAEGAYESAQAALQKLQSTTAANTSLSSSQAQTAAQGSATALTVAQSAAYAALDDAVHAKADTLFNNPRSALPTLQAFTIPDSQLVITLNNERSSIELPLNAAHDAAVSSGDFEASTKALFATAKTTLTFLNHLIDALNQAVPNAQFSQSTIATDQATLGAARSEITTAISALTAAKSAYDAAKSGAQSAQNTATGGTQSDIAGAQAAVKSAQGALALARSSFEKTIVRSPIGGTIVSLPVTRGDFVSSFAQVAVISNPGALYADAQVTQDDAKTIASGNSATIEGTIPGVVTFVAPALDPTTGKIEVKIGIKGSQSGLTDGEAVTLSLDRSVAQRQQQKSTQITIPIIAAKILPTGPVVFTTTASSTLESHPITLGTILGDQVVVISGLTPDMTIVTDARGLSAGQQVVVDAH
jgi:multidrug efflux pump subunit AcrA (membrane-fusion protein)